MPQDVWLPRGTELPDGARAGQTILNGTGWQILATGTSGRALLVEPDLHRRWCEGRLITPETFHAISFGQRTWWALTSGSDHALVPISDAPAPRSRLEALSFALALRATREISTDLGLQDAIYVERIARLLPTFSITPHADDDVVLGYWLTGGIPLSATATRRLEQVLSWLPPDALAEIVQTAGVAGSASTVSDVTKTPARGADPEQPGSTLLQSCTKNRVFQLPGRADLEAFFNEHVIDIVINPERYRTLGILHPPAVVLHGPPGCGKTFAVERLVEFLGWPSFEVEAASIASPYIHETSRKIAEVFEKAMASAPSVLVIDEMESFLASRDTAGGHHRLEETAEFLRRIPEAVNGGVLVIAMTNKLEMVDPAILRRGRFDHILHVGFAGETEIAALLTAMLHDLPCEADIDVPSLADALAGRPLSDVTFVVREASRLAARSGRETLDAASLNAALQSSPAREQDGEAPRRIGFFLR